MAFCKNCGTQNTKEKSFCKNCGSNFVKVENGNEQKETQIIPPKKNLIITNYNEKYEQQFPNKKNKQLLYTFLCIGLIVIGFLFYKYYWNNNNSKEPSVVFADTVINSSNLIKESPIANSNNQQIINTPNQSYQEDAITLSSEQSDLIRKYILAEDNRDFSIIEEMITIPMDKYFDLNSPSLEQIKNRYEHLWGITSHSKTIVTNIQMMQKYIYMVDYDYEYFGNKTKTFNQQKNKKMFYRFNDENKIESIYE